MIEPLLARKDIGDLIQDEEFLIVVGILMATLLVGALILSYVDRWRKRQLADDSTSDVDQLGSFRAMYERGELSKEEYERVRAKVALRIKEKIAPKATPVQPAESPKQEPDATQPPT